MSCRKPRAEHPIGDLVEGLRRHREQPRPVRHGEPAQQPAAEELDHARRGVEHGQGVARRRRVDDDEVVLARGVEVVQLLHRQVVVAVHEAAGDVLVQRVGQHGVADLGVGRVAADQLVPARLGVEHRRPQLAAAARAGGVEGGVRHPRGAVAEGADAEGVGEAAGRVDGEHEHLAALLDGGGEPEGGGDRRLADAARPEHEHHLLARRAARRCRRRRAASRSAMGDIRRPARRRGASATSDDDAPPGRLGEQLGHVEHGQAGRDAGPQPLEVAAADAPAGLGDWAAASDLAHAGAGGVDEHGSAAPRRSTTSAWRRSNSAGSTRLATIADGATPVSGSRRPSRSIVSVTGISSGVVTTTRPVAVGVLEDVGHPRASGRAPCRPARARGSPGARRSGRRCGRSPRRRRRRGRSGARGPRRRACRRRGSP